MRRVTQTAYRASTLTETHLELEIEEDEVKFLSIEEEAETKLG